MPRGASAVRGRNHGYRHSRPTQGTFHRDPVTISPLRLLDIEPLPIQATSIPAPIDDQHERSPQTMQLPVLTHRRRPYFPVGTEVLIDKPGYRTADDLRPNGRVSWRQWRTYTVRRNDLLITNDQGNLIWMYQLSEVQGQATTNAEEHYLYEVAHPIHTRVEFIHVRGACKYHGIIGHGCEENMTKKRANPAWIIEACRLEGPAGYKRVVYDVQDEQYGGMSGLRVHIEVNQLAPYTGPHSDEDGGWEP
jgi:hypothetical protein